MGHRLSEKTVVPVDFGGGADECTRVGSVKFVVLLCWLFAVVRLLRFNPFAQVKVTVGDHVVRDVHRFGFALALDILEGFEFKTLESLVCAARVVKLLVSVFRNVGIHLEVF